MHSLGGKLASTHVTKSAHSLGKALNGCGFLLYAISHCTALPRSRPHPQTIWLARWEGPSGWVTGALLTPPHSTKGAGSLPHQEVLRPSLWPEADIDDGEWRIEGCPTKEPAEGGSVGVFLDHGAHKMGGDDC